MDYEEDSIPNSSASKTNNAIEILIENSKREYGRFYSLYLVWGYINLVCTLSQFYLEEVIGYPKPYLVWLLTWIACVYQFIFISGERKKQRLKTHIGRIISAVWITFILVFFLYGIVAEALIGDEFQKILIPGYICVLAIPTFLTGVILYFRPLIIGAIICWILCVLCIWVLYSYQIFLLSASVIVVLIIPGHMLQLDYKKYQAKLHEVEKI